MSRRGRHFVLLEAVPLLVLKRRVAGVLGAFRRWHSPFYDFRGGGGGCGGGGEGLLRRSLWRLNFGPFLGPLASALLCNRDVLDKLNAKPATTHGQGEVMIE